MSFMQNDIRWQSGCFLWMLYLTCTSPVPHLDVNLLRTPLEAPLKLSPGRPFTARVALRADASYSDTQQTLQGCGADSVSLPLEV
ncbi:hypothetical protein EYF80_038903 [Liparis tanakae]|uniref:Uncharacterized protein n=1 Tax=Liparis tanakae TaxID=230148 RepID=A0A4Z2GBY3_9TELE|nr:hypothetical protein EYF80_038903 [Liparis tanakae]